MRNFIGFPFPITRLPFYSPLVRPGQEEGNVPFVEDSGFGKYSGDPSVIADTVSSWLASPEKMEAMKAAALKAARPSATLDIASDLADIAFAKKQTKEKVLVRSR
jgi:1,2-diacylglycerol 3-beta-galactosyltransferase